MEMRRDDGVISFWARLSDSDLDMLRYLEVAKMHLYKMHVARFVIQGNHHTRSRGNGKGIVQNRSHMKYSISKRVGVQSKINNYVT